MTRCRMDGVRFAGNGRTGDELAQRDAVAHAPNADRDQQRRNQQPDCQPSRLALRREPGAGDEERHDEHRRGPRQIGQRRTQTDHCPLARTVSAARAHEQIEQQEREENRLRLGPDAAAGEDQRRHQRCDRRRDQRDARIRAHDQRQAIHEHDNGGAAEYDVRKREVGRGSRDAVDRRQRKDCARRTERRRRPVGTLRVSPRLRQGRRDVVKARFVGAEPERAAAQLGMADDENCEDAHEDRCGNTERQAPAPPGARGCVQRCAQTVARIRRAGQFALDCVHRASRDAACRPFADAGVSTERHVSVAVGCASAKPRSRPTGTAPPGECESCRARATAG